MSSPPSSTLEYKGWVLVEDEYEDGDGFYTPEYYAQKDGEQKHLHHSRFRFTPTLERFAYLIDAGFPSHPPRPDGKPYPLGPWTDADVDAAIEKLRSQQP